MFTCIPVGVWMRTSAGPSVSANKGAWIEMRRATVMVIMAIFVRSLLCSLIFGYVKSFPQFGQGSGGFGFLNTFVVMASRISVPMNIRRVAPKVWNTWSAS